MFVKICGVRTVEDARMCADAGADAVGFNFWPGSIRFVTPDAIGPGARSLPSSLLRVGVFVNPTGPEVVALLASGFIDVAQLHGDEPPTLGPSLGGRFWKALRLEGDASLAELERHALAERLVIDAAGPGWGGTGRLANWALAARAAERHRVLLAGGLTPENVAEAIAAVRPYGVDVAGGVETAPGVKAPERVAAFLRAAKEAV